jgi:hypothetical protein
MKLKIFAIILALSVVSNAQPVPDNICEGLELEFISHPTNCNLFILCVWELPHVVECRFNEIFDPELRTCVPGEF